ncbi:MAG: allantoinase AllB [Ferruginibacter sp.]
MSNLKKIFSRRCWINDKLLEATISFKDGIISGIDLEKLTGAEDFGNAVIMPGVIDAHVHINEPGRTDWEGFDTATQAAAAGGITSIVDMPLNASPVTTTLQAFNEKLEASKNKLNVNVGFYGGLIPGNKNNLEEMMQAGVLGIKCFLTHSGIDEFPNVGENEIDEAMPIIKKYSIPLLAHCEIYDEEVPNNLSEDSGSYQNYLASRPKKWENNAIELMIKLCRKNNCPTHIVHVSSAEALKLITAAKVEGLPLTAETCPHYFYFNAEAIPDKNTLFKCAPPIREKENNILLKKALQNGTLDFITTDHSPAPADTKELETGNLQKAWGGIAGLQFLLSSSWTGLKDLLSLETFIPLLTEHPAQFLSIQKSKGKIKAGHDADFVIWEPEETFEVIQREIFHRHKATPYAGEILYGKINETIVNGITVYKNKMIINKNAGKWLLKK